MKLITEDTQENEIPEFTGSSAGGLRARLERYEQSAGGGIQAVLDVPGPEPEVDPEPPTAAVEPISPELALVDPELASRARAQLPDPRPFTTPAVEFEPSSNRIVLADLPPPAEPEPVLEREPRSRKRRAAWAVLGLLALVAAVAAIVYAGLVYERSGNESSAPAPQNPAPPNVPASEPAPVPSVQPPAPAASPRSFVWAPVHGARWYLVQFYRGSTEVFRARPTEARVVVPSHWSYKGHRLSLKPGSYRWSVRPRLGGKRYGKPIVLSRLVIQRSSSGGGQSTRNP